LPNKDYELLSEKIQEKTAVYLISSILKRIWARVKYDSNPSTTTLDTLASFLDYPNWRSFRRSVNKILSDSNFK
jgi:ubiquinone biosynthesis protein COQ9